MSNIYDHLDCVDMEDDAPFAIDIIRDPDFTTGQSPVEEMMSHLASPSLDPKKKAKIHGNLNLGLYLTNAKGEEIPAEHLKREVQAFNTAIRNSPARSQITHLDVGYAYVLEDLPHTELSEPEKDTTDYGELRLHQWNQVLLTDPDNTSDLQQSLQNRALLARMARWVGMALPEIRTLTLHDDPWFLHCSVEDGYLEELVMAFPKLEEVSIVCDEPFVAISYIVFNGERVAYVSDSMVETARKLRGREYYANRK